MIIIEFFLSLLFINEIINSNNILWSIFNSLFLVLTIASIIYELTKKDIEN